MALQLISLGRSKEPLYNEVSNSLHFQSNVRYITESLYKKIRETPELLSMLDTAVTDHFLGPVDFYDADGKPLGPTRSRKINRFWEDENVQGSSFYGQAMDYFIDGSGFGWHVSANTIFGQKQKEFIIKMKEIDPDFGMFAEQEANMPRRISYLAASTVTIKHDETGIKYYIQEAAGNRVRWEPEQVVYTKLMEMNGEVRGYTPLKALVNEIVIMYMLKENIIAKLQNGGSPDYIISIKGANGVSRARFERLRTSLESFSHLRKSHGNMPIDADVAAIPLGMNMKDMEYRELAMFTISEFALALGLPVSRVPFLMSGAGGSSNRGELSGNSEDSYQSKINSRRQQWENAWNRVFRTAGFPFRFRRDNLQDDVRETQASTQRAAFVLEVQNSLQRAGKRLRLPSHLALLSGHKMNIEEDDVEEEEETMLIGGGAFAGPGGPLQPGKADSKGLVAKQRIESKERNASNHGVSA